MMIEYNTIVADTSTAQYDYTFTPILNDNYVITHMVVRYGIYYTYNTNKTSCIVCVCVCVRAFIYKFHHILRCSLFFYNIIRYY